MSETAESGKLSVHTENLFPIIKKWLYSEHDIFLRELVSNAVDACTKLARLSGLGQYRGDLAAARVDIDIDKKAKTLTIRDNGVGMTRDEVKQYINQIAFSGASDFLEKYKNAEGEGAGIIGHFGMGFFSAFMVSHTVTLRTRSWQDGAVPVEWTCDGSVNFSMQDGDRAERGTDVVLHLNEDSLEFLEEPRVRELVTKYSDFLPAQIFVNGSRANAESAPWNERLGKVTDDDAKNLYKKLFPFDEEPLFWVHFHVEHPFSLKGLLFFPKIRQDFDPTVKGHVRLYANRVFVSDQVADLLPSYLNLLRGVIDSPDIPLNVSRSALQSDAQVKKIGAHVSAKVAERLTALFKTDRPTFEKHWKDIQLFVKFASLSDEKFYDKVKDAVLYSMKDGSLVTPAEYKEKNAALGDRVIYASDPEAQIAYVKAVEAKGVQVAVFDSPIDSHFVQLLESKIPGSRFQRVDSDTPEHLVHDVKGESEAKADEKAFGDLVKSHLGKDKIEVKVQSLGVEGPAAWITQNEHLRRFSDMTATSRGKQASLLGDSHTLVLNPDHRLMTRIKLWSTLPEKQQDAKDLAKSLYDLALLKQSGLQGEALADFADRVTRLLEKGE